MLQQLDEQLARRDELGYTFQWSWPDPEGVTDRQRNAPFHLQLAHKTLKITSLLHSIRGFPANCIC